MAIRRILLVVEGEKDEKTILGEILTLYGFVKEEKEKDVLIWGQDNECDTFIFKKDKSEVVIVEGPRNRIKDFLKYLEEQDVDFENFTTFDKRHFNATFLIYDVDHNEDEHINKMIERFSDESSGLLLLNCPCLETISGVHHLIHNKKLFHLKEYKKRLNTHLEEHHKCHSKQFIVKHFNKLALEFLDKNVRELGCTNINEHPRLIIEYINKHNIRFNTSDKNECYVVYRYFTTVIYVMIAYLRGLTVQIDHYDTVRNFFLRHCRQESNNITIDHLDIE